MVSIGMNIATRWTATARSRGGRTNEREARIQRMDEHGPGADQLGRGKALAQGMGGEILAEAAALPATIDGEPAEHEDGQDGRLVAPQAARHQAPLHLPGHQAVVGDHPATRQDDVGARRPALRIESAAM